MTFLGEVKEVRSAIALIFGIAVIAWGAGVATPRWINVPMIQAEQENQLDRLDSLVTVMGRNVGRQQAELLELRRNQDSAWAAVASLARSVDRFSIAACMVIEQLPELQCRRRMEIRE